MRPCVVQYLYVHEPGEEFDYPNSRSPNGVAAVAAQYMECALVQTASLLLRDVDCDVVFVTNLADERLGGRRAWQLLGAIRDLGAEIVHADYTQRPAAPIAEFMSSQYIYDAILAVAERSPPDRQLWLMDVDCVWFDPWRVFAVAPPSPRIGCIRIPYPLDWDISGFTRRDVGELAQRLGAPPPDESVDWVGGELLVGTAADLRALVVTCKELEREVVAMGYALHTEEHLLSLVLALGRVPFHDLTTIARRAQTGPRHEAPPIENPTTIGVWHLPSEKGLGFRRGARAVLSGHGRRLTRDLEVPARALRRFNIAGGGLSRRVRDDSWIASQRLRREVTARIARH